MSRVNDLTGQQFGRLTAVENTGQKRWGVYLWRCECACGEEHVAASNSLRSGLVQSCGCLLRETSQQNTTHGQWGSPTYRSWDNMIQRCTNPANAKYESYGGRGITVCERWRKFENFLADMGERPDGKTIDRIENDKGYEPVNCRWATPLEQTHNRRPYHRRTRAELALAAGEQ